MIFPRIVSPSGLADRSSVVAPGEGVTLCGAAEIFGSPQPWQFLRQWRWTVPLWPIALASFGLSQEAGERKQQPVYSSQARGVSGDGVLPARARTGDLLTG